MRPISPDPSTLPGACDPNFSGGVGFAVYGQADGHFDRVKIQALEAASQ